MKRELLAVVVAAGLLMVAGLPAALGADLVCIDKEGATQELTCGKSIAPFKMTAQMDPRFSTSPSAAQEELLQLKFFQGKTEATSDVLHFYSAYGDFKACLLCVVSGWSPFVALTTTYSHGTNVRRKRLTIYKAEGESIEPVLTVLVFGFFGYGSWSYRTEFVDLNSDGDVDLRLVLEHTPVEESRANDSALLPKAKVLEYVFNRVRQAYEPSPIKGE